MLGLKTSKECLIKLILKMMLKKGTGKFFFPIEVHMKNKKTIFNFIYKKSLGICQMKKTKLRIFFCETNGFRIYKLICRNYLKG